MLQALLRLSTIKAEISVVSRTGFCRNSSHQYESHKDLNKDRYDCLFCYFVRIAKAQTQEELKTTILSMYNYVQGGHEFLTQSDSIEFLYSKLLNHPFGTPRSSAARLKKDIFSCNPLPANLPTLEWETNIPEVYLPSLPDYLTEPIKKWLLDSDRTSYTELEEKLHVTYRLNTTNQMEASHNKNFENIHMACNNELKTIFEKGKGKSLTWHETAQLLNEQMNDSKGTTLNLQVQDRKNFQLTQNPKPKVLIFQNSYWNETGGRRWTVRRNSEGLSYLEENTELFPNQVAIELLYAAAIPLKLGKCELKSVLIKYGGRRGGHYVCSVKEDDRWIFYNDGNTPEAHQTTAMYWSYDKLLKEAREGRRVMPMAFLYEM